MRLELTFIFLLAAILALCILTINSINTIGSENLQKNIPIAILIASIITYPIFKIIDWFARKSIK